MVCTIFLLLTQDIIQLMDNDSKILLYGQHLHSIALDLQTMITKNTYYNTRTKDITDNFITVLKTFHNEVTKYNQIAYNKPRPTVTHECTGVIDLYPKSQLCNAKSSALFFSTLYSIKFPNNILDSQNFIKHFFEIVNAIWNGILSIKQNGNLQLAANTFKTSIDNMTRQDYLIITCANNNNNNNTCHKALSVLLCKFHSVMPRIVMYDVENANNASSNLDTLSNFIDDNVKDEKECNICRTNVLKLKSGLPLLTGGNVDYYHKYLKYKNKYFRLKQK